MTGNGWVSLAFLILALAFFVAFHLLPGFEEDRGWFVWAELWNIAKPPIHVDAADLVIISSFLSFSFLILVSSFLGNVWRKSKWARRGALLFSGLSGGIFWTVYFYQAVASGGDTAALEAGGWCLLLSSFFNFTGLLVAEPDREVRPEMAGV